MLRANEFTVGTLEDAEPLSLLLPSSKYGGTFLIGRIGDNPGAILLDSMERFVAFPCAGAANWRGLLIRDVRIEIDETSLLEPDYRPKPGALMRINTHLIVGAKSDRGLGLGIQMVLESDLVPTHEGNSAAFSKWSIVIGEGQDRRELLKVDADAKQENLD